MKRKIRRGLVYLLTFVFVGAAWMLPDFPVSAGTENKTQKTGVQKPEVLEKTADSIMLRAEDKYEYAIESEQQNVQEKVQENVQENVQEKLKENAQDKSKAWKWAQEGQYDRKNGTVIFTGLQAAKEYQFACRKEGEEGILYQNKVMTEALEKQTQLPPTGTQESTQNPPAGVQETAQNPQAGSQETVQNPPAGAQETAQNPPAGAQETAKNPPAGNQETTQNNPPAGIQETTQAPSAGTEDINEKEEDKKAEDSNSVKDEKKTLNATKDPRANLQNNANQQPKASKPAAPDAPLVLDVKDTEITLGQPENALLGYNYEYSSNGIDFQSDPVFKNLKPGTEYDFYIRVAAGVYNGTDFLASDASVPIHQKTKLSAPEKPQFPPELTDRTNTGITVKASEQEKDPSTLEFGMLGQGTNIEWNATGKFENLSAGTEYQFFVRRIVDETVQMTGEASDALRVMTLQDPAKAPSPPELLKRSDSTIVLKGVDNQQYAMMLPDGTANWQDSAVFDGLNPDTEYQFITREEYNPDIAMESIPSEVSKFKTAIGFQGARIDGIENGGSYEAETTWTATAVGAGMENASPSVGDTRWAPYTWTWDGTTIKSWDKAPYTVKFKCTELGNYKLTVGYQLEEFTAEGWKATEYSKSLSTSFKIIEKKVIAFTIVAEAGVNGKINPSGSVDVEKGKDFEFTFIPNNGYRVAKVFVDGKEVKVTDNRYAFKDVQNNHKISVTFEKDKRTPKTGDRTEFVIVLGIFLISGFAVVMLAYRKRKR